MNPSWFLTFFFTTAIFSATSSLPQNGPASADILKSPPQIIPKHENSTDEQVDPKEASESDYESLPPLSPGIPVPGLEESDETLEALNATINREKRTLGVLSRFYCSIFYRNSPSDCPVGRRWRTDNDVTVSTPDKQAQDDFWLNYLGNNGTNGTDAVFVPTTESTNYYPQTPTKSGILGLLFNRNSNGPHPIRNTFRALFPRLSGYFSPGGDSSTSSNSLDGDAVGSGQSQRSWFSTMWTRIVNWWTRAVARFQRLRAGIRGFRDGYRGTNSDSSTSGGGYGDSSSTRAGGLDISGLLQNIDLSALLRNFQT